jgi:hypothetical protein
VAEADEQNAMQERSYGGLILAVCIVLFTVGSTLAVVIRGPSGKEMGREIGVLLAAGLTLIMFSFLYRDNPLFKIAENLYVGVALGFQVMVFWYSFMKVEAFDPFAFAPSSEALWQAIGERSFPILLGILLLTRLSSRYSWLSRYTYALLVGWGAGIGIATAVDSFVLRQIHAAIKPLSWGDPAGIAWGLFVLAGTFTVLFYFFFSVEHRGAGGAVSRVGIWFLMVAFGASFGYTVMARVSLLIGRLQFLLGDWLGFPL